MCKRGGSETALTLRYLMRGESQVALPQAKLGGPQAAPKLAAKPGGSETAHMLALFTIWGFKRGNYALSLGAKGQGPIRGTAWGV